MLKLFGGAMDTSRLFGMLCLISLCLCCCMSMALGSKSGVSYSRNVGTNYDKIDSYGKSSVTRGSFYEFCVKSGNLCEARCAIPPHRSRDCSQFDDGRLECWCNGNLIHSGHVNGSLRTTLSVVVLFFGSAMSFLF